MEPTVVVVLLGAIVAVLVARGGQATPERERVPVRIDDAQPPVRHR
jgi:hypothetical protein